MDTIKVGSKIKIVRMDGEPQYAGREGDALTTLKYAERRGIEIINLAISEK